MKRIKREQPLPQELDSELVEKDKIRIEIYVYRKRITDPDSPYSIMINWSAYGLVSKEFAKDFANLLNDAIDKAEKKEKGLRALGYKVE